MVTPGSAAATDNRRPVRVLVVDGHPALRDGLQGLLREENGFLCVGALPGPERLHDAIADLRLEVVVVD